MGAKTARRAQDRRERVACLFGGRIRAGLVSIAASVGLTRRDTGQTDARAFGTPHRTVTIPDCRGSAGEGLSGGDNRNRGEQEGEGQHQGMYLRRGHSRSINANITHAEVTFERVHGVWMHAHRRRGCWAAKATPSEDNR